MDMSAWVIHCWHDLERWLQDGPITPFCKTVDLDWTPEHSKKFEREFPFTGLHSLLKRFTSTSLLSAMNQNAPDQVVIDVTRVRQKASKKIPHETNPFAGLLEIKTALFAFIGELASSFWRQLRSPFQKSECDSGSDAAHAFEFNEPFVRFGKALAYGDFKGDGFKSLVISAPYLGGNASDSYHTGGIFVMKSNLSGSELSDNIRQTIRLPKEFESAGQRFGYAMTVVDLNRDGIDDLAVSAPSSGSLRLEYNGCVFVFFGVRDKGLNQYPDIIIKPKVKQPYHRPGQTWENRFIVLGEQLHSFDLDGDGFADLLIASPHASPLPGRHQLGQVHAFLSSSNHSGTRTLSDSDWSLSGTQDYEAFGSSVAYLPSAKTSNATIFVGSPGYRRNVTDAAQGRIYGFQMRKRHSPRLKFAVASENQYSRFGGSMIVGDFQK
jgi:hypothetical protein